jgi:RNA polymerase sigma-70 factor (ECF subfamily)
MKRAANDSVRRSDASAARSSREIIRGEPQEITLIERAKRGDGEAFNILFKREQKYLYNLMSRLTGDVAAADDLTQEAFLKALNHIASFNHQASIRTWLTKIAINLFRNEYRKRVRHSSLCLERILIPANGVNPERMIIKSELQWCILHNLRYHLPKKYREVLVLRDLHCLNYKEISDILGCSISLTKTRLHRARKLFQNQFIDGRCRAYTDDYLCICEGILSLSAEKPSEGALKAPRP